MRPFKLKPTPSVVEVGSLRDDFGTLADCVVRTLVDGPRLVWARDDGVVFSAATNRNKVMPVSWIVGTFLFGHPTLAIADDLRALAHERSKNWILD